MRCEDGRLIGSVVHTERLSFWLNQRADSPTTLRAMRASGLLGAPRHPRIEGSPARLGYGVSEITDREYGQTEFFVIDDDGHFTGLEYPPQDDHACRTERNGTR
jgi:hypothetical protein